MAAAVTPAPTLKRLRLRLVTGDVLGQRAGEVVVYLEELGDPPRALGQVVIPVELVPHLAVLGLLVGLKAIAELQIVGPGAPKVLELEPRVIRLIKLAGKVLS